MNVHIADSEAEYCKYLHTFLLEYVDKVESDRLITIGLSGGSMPKYLCCVLKRLSMDKKQQIRFFPVDERLVPQDNADNNMSAYLSESTGYSASSFICIDEDTLENAELAASKFEARLKELKPEITENGFPIFDILFLGLGPDGHTCSLFPGHPLLQEKSKWVAAIEDSPKPPPRRVTITLPVINCAREVLFLVTGESKAEVVKEIIQNKNKKFPPSLIERTETKWVLDKPASSKL